MLNTSQQSLCKARWKEWDCRYELNMSVILFPSQNRCASSRNVPVKPWGGQSVSTPEDAVGFQTEQERLVTRHRVVSTPGKRACSCTWTLMAISIWCCGVPRRHMSSLRARLEFSSIFHVVPSWFRSAEELWDCWRTKSERTNLPLWAPSKWKL